MMYGGMQPSYVDGVDAFRGHDARRSWNDGGEGFQAVEAIIADVLDNIKDRMRGDVENYGARQAKNAVLDYVEGSHMDLTVVDGRIHLALDMSNNEAQLIALWDLSSLIEAARNSANQQGDDRFADSLNGLLDLFALQKPAQQEQPSRGRSRSVTVKDEPPARQGRIAARPAVTSQPVEPPTYGPGRRPGEPLHGRRIGVDQYR